MIGEVAIVARVSDAMMSGRVAMTMTMSVPMCILILSTCRSIFISRGLLAMCGYGWRRIGRGRRDRAVEIF